MLIETSGGLQSKQTSMIWKSRKPGKLSRKKILPMIGDA
jgi:hypothetical protein